MLVLLTNQINTKNAEMLREGKLPIQNMAWKTLPNVHFFIKLYEIQNLPVDKVEGKSVRVTARWVFIPFTTRLLVNIYSPNFAYS